MIYRSFKTVVLEGTGTFDVIFTVVGPPALELGPDEIPIEYYTTNQVRNTNTNTHTFSISVKIQCSIFSARNDE